MGPTYPYYKIVQLGNKKYIVHKENTVKILSPSSTKEKYGKRVLVSNYYYGIKLLRFSWFFYSFCKTPLLRIFWLLYYPELRLLIS